MGIARALKNVAIADEMTKFSETLVRDGNVYIATLEEPLVIQTPIITLASDLATDGELASFVNLKLRTSTLPFFKAVEDAIRAVAIERKATWFREDIDDETVIKSMRAFVNESEKLLRVRIAESFVAFDGAKNKIDPPPPGTRVKAVLELSRLTFSKTQFGGVWNVKQIRLTDDQYLFDDEVAHGLCDSINDSILAVQDEGELETSL